MSILIVKADGTVIPAAMVQFHPAWGLRHAGNNAWIVSAATAGGDWTQEVSHDLPQSVTREITVTRSVTRTVTADRERTVTDPAYLSVTRDLSHTVTAWRATACPVSVTREYSVSGATATQTRDLSVTREVTQATAGASSVVTREVTVTKYVGDPYCAGAPDEIYRACFEWPGLTEPECRCVYDDTWVADVYWVIVGGPCVDCATGACDEFGACSPGGIWAAGPLPVCEDSIGGPYIPLSSYCWHWAVWYP